MARSLIPNLFAVIAVLSTPVSAASSNELFITPHPDLPSLESLGITPAQLYDMAVNLTDSLPVDPQNRRSTLPGDELHNRSAAYTDHCDTKLCAPAGRLAAAGCVSYLQVVPNVPFTVGRAFTVLSSSQPGAPGEDSALIMGYAIVTNPRTQFEPKATSLSRDVVTAAKWIIQSCYSCRDDNICGVGGTAAAGGNGDFLVYFQAAVMAEGDC